MYEVDEHDRVVELDDVPQSDTAAPTPVLVAEEGRLQLAYVARRPKPPGNEVIAVITFDQPYAHMFGLPNDETLHGHPLYDRGLTFYGVFRVESSSWIRRLERLNSVHDRHRPEAYEALTHFIFAFHDSTFECVALGLRYEIHSEEDPPRLSVEVRV